MDVARILVRKNVLIPQFTDYIATNRYLLVPLYVVDTITSTQNTVTVTMDMNSMLIILVRIYMM